MSSERACKDHKLKHDKYIQQYYNHFLTRKYHHYYKRRGWPCIYTYFLWFLLFNDGDDCLFAWRIDTYMYVRCRGNMTHNLFVSQTLMVFYIFSGAYIHKLYTLWEQLKLILQSSYITYNSMIKYKFTAQNYIQNYFNLLNIVTLISLLLKTRIEPVPYFQVKLQFLIFLNK